MRVIYQLLHCLWVSDGAHRRVVLGHVSQLVVSEADRVEGVGSSDHGGNDLVLDDLLELFLLVRDENGVAGLVAEFLDSMVILIEFSFVDQFQGFGRQVHDLSQSVFYVSHCALQRELQLQSLLQHSQGQTHFLLHSSITTLMRPKSSLRSSKQLSHTNALLSSSSKRLNSSPRLSHRDPRVSKAVRLIFSERSQEKEAQTESESAEFLYQERENRCKQMMSWFQTNYKISNLRQPTYLYFKVDEKSFVQKAYLCQYIDLHFGIIAKTFPHKLKLEFIDYMRLRTLRAGEKVSPLSDRVCLFVHSGCLQSQQGECFQNKLIKQIKQQQLVCSQPAQLVQVRLNDLQYRWQILKQTQKQELLDFIRRRSLLRKLDFSKTQLFYREFRFDSFEQGEMIGDYKFGNDFFGLVFKGTVVKKLEVSVQKSNYIPFSQNLDNRHRLNRKITNRYQLNIKFREGEFFRYENELNGVKHQEKEQYFCEEECVVMLLHTDVLKLLDEKQLLVFRQEKCKKFPQNYQKMQESVVKELDSYSHELAVKFKAVQRHLQTFNSEELRKTEERLEPRLKEWSKKLKRQLRKNLINSKLVLIKQRINLEK